MVLIILFIAASSLYIGYQFGRDNVPKDCAELGALHLQIGKEALRITSSDTKQWNQLIQDETALTNLCYQSIEK